MMTSKFGSEYKQYQQQSRRLFSVSLVALPGTITVVAYHKGFK